MIVLFIALAILTISAIIFFILFPLIKRANLKKNFLAIYGKGIYKIANYYDYYLINRLLLKANDDSRVSIDHLLLANKYIYVIKDYYINGQLKGKEADQSWIYYFGNEKAPKEQYLNNPLIENEYRVKKLSMVTGLDKSMLISIVLINDDADLKLELSKNECQFVIKRSGLKKLIEEIESRDVAPLNNEQLAYAVRDIAALNLNSK